MSLDIEIEKLNQILKDFYLLSGFRIGIYDVDGKEITAFPYKICNFCYTLRQNEKANSICLKSDIEALKIVASTQTIHIYQCQFGLTEAVAPILEDKKVIGFIVIGQIIENGIDIKNNIFLNCSQYFESDEIIKKKLNEVVVLSHDQIKAAASLMGICTSYLSITKQIKLMRTLQSQKLKEYINTNFRRQITLNELCNKFELGRTTICNLIKRELKMSLLDYINNLRIEEAKRLLVDTELQIKELSIMSGFIDQNYFSRLFKKNVGTTPTQFRVSKCKIRSNAHFNN